MKTSILTLLSLCFFLIPSQVLAGQPRLMASYGDWEVYVFFEDNNKVCYMASQPKLKEGNYTKRGEPFALITHRPADNTRDVFSYITGYSYKAASEAVVKIDEQEFVLFTQDETAWGPDADTDRRLARAIREGNKMVVTGVSSRGTETKDTFSLSGSAKAYERAAEECR
ncbi:MAG: invasion associated locus B family protein [Pseudomonadota bacterium]